MIRARVALAAVIAVAVLRAQDAPPPRPTFRTEANYVRVDAYPTLNGAPVLDLRQDEFEVLDNGVPQKIEQFEHVQISAAGPQETRLEPNTVAQSRQMIEDPRARVFVIFLDTYHVTVSGSHRIRRPLIEALDRMIGADDMVAVMTPEMSARDVAFARKTTTIEGFLTRYWPWGERDQISSKDPEEDAYWRCYPGNGPTKICPDDDRGVATEMIDRRREKRTIDALQDLVTFLRGVREERKAVLAVTEGWLLYRPDANLKRKLFCQVPGTPEIYVDPRSGRPTTTKPNAALDAGMMACDRDRMQLADVDDEYEFRRILDEANRANTSFYPVDPRGLAVFDTEIVPPRGPSLGPAPMVPPSVDARMLQSRITTLRTLAEATDGEALVNSNDITGGLRRVVADLSSYYLLGYYSSMSLDGKFHKITVRIKRPGVQVRARRGYLAASAAELARPTAAAATAPPDVAASARTAAVSAAIAPLNGYARELPLRLSGVAAGPLVYVVGDLGAAEARTDWAGGGDVDVMLVGPDGGTAATSRAKIAAGARSFEVSMPAPAPGEYEVRVRARAAATTSAMNESTRVTVAAAGGRQGVRFIRRIGSRAAATADLRFRRGETVRAEWPATSGTLTARLLDRAGNALAVPVSTARLDDAGNQWDAAEVSLAPLAPGDYVIELTAASERRLAGIRVVP